MLRVQRWEGCSVVYELAASFKAENRKVNVGDAWFQVSSLSLWVLSLLVLFAFFWSVPAVEKFVSYIVFLFWSDQIGFSLLFTAKVTDWPKNYCYFLTNFIDIALCTNRMHKNPFLYFEESLSTDNIQWMLLWVLVAIIILCTW